MEIKQYEKKYETAWLHCRLLSFFETAYYDDVYTSVPKYEKKNALKIIAVENEQVLGLIDVIWDSATLKETSLAEGKGAVIEHLAIHPAFQGRGIAQQLYDTVLQTLADEGVDFIEVWTRDDVGANRFYQKQGFEVASQYFHVYGKKQQAVDSTLVSGFYHVLELEQLAQYETTRVHLCYGYLKWLNK
ncbi:GNAT family N-acetyltransferase [Isobaculum melis]|uniref:Acetyltransferase (GNAT) family protein n=1 Tax=Isobaculum melis TaxID=142588 RepID=A0A1H9TJT5_9LACT|nr:N-acetyltransferase [Isobaculum melis]SER97590.1 Acetyltransferase (GNAT) family protein [Isobaculum melis]